MNQACACAFLTSKAPEEVLLEVALVLRLLQPMPCPHLLVNLAAAEGGSPEVEGYPPDSGVKGIWCSTPAIGLVAITLGLGPLPQMDDEKRPRLLKFVGVYYLGTSRILHQLNG